LYKIPPEASLVLACEVKPLDELTFLVVRSELGDVNIVCGVGLKTFEESTSTFKRVGHVLFHMRGGLGSPGF
jgi:hypothetical protein